MSTPQNLTVGRLSLHPAALTESQARRLAELVALALGTISARSVDRVSVAVSPQTANTPEQIAEAVARAIENALRMESAQ